MWVQCRYDHGHEWTSNKRQPQGKRLTWKRKYSLPLGSETYWHEQPLPKLLNLEGNKHNTKMPFYNFILWMHLCRASKESLHSTLFPNSNTWILYLLNFITHIEFAPTSWSSITDNWIYTSNMSCGRTQQYHTILTVKMMIHLLLSWVIN